MTNATFSVLAAFTFVVTIPSARAQPALPESVFEWAMEYIGAALWIDELYRRVKCAKPAELPAQAETAALRVLQLNHASLSEARSWDSWSREYRSLRPRLVQYTRTRVGNLQLENAGMDITRCAFIGGYAYGMFYASEASLMRAIESASKGRLPRDSASIRRFPSTLDLLVDAVPTTPDDREERSRRAKRAMEGALQKDAN